MTDQPPSPPTLPPQHFPPADRPSRSQLIRLLALCFLAMALGSAWVWHTHRLHRPDFVAIEPSNDGAPAHLNPRSDSSAPPTPGAPDLRQSLTPGLAPPPQAHRIHRPNILLISIDTLRPDRLGCYGDPQHPLYGGQLSPHLDRLAQRLLLFTQAHSQAPWTLPSHMSLFTSMLPTSNGVDNINETLPSDIPTLAELLKKSGYRTAAIVNNGQMQAHWGFNRGFDLWQEHEVDTPEADCEHLTAEATAWIRDHKSDEPWFLFVHFFDMHDPYKAPERFRQITGATLTPEQARELCNRYKTPAAGAPDAATLKQIRAAYDAQVPWVDEQVGKLVDAAGEDAAIVVFSDHGEAFKEHGWMLHGATLYEEATHTVLMVHEPFISEDITPTRRIDTPVALLDVTPTILSLAECPVPETMEGAPLQRFTTGHAGEPRVVPAQTKALLEGRVCYSVIAGSFKTIYTLFDGQTEVYKLPDEQTPLVHQAGAAALAAEKLNTAVADWVRQTPYWMVHAAGHGDFEATITASEGAFAIYLPVGFEDDRDSLEVSADGKTLHWHVYPRGLPVPKALYLETTAPNASLQIDLTDAGEHVPALLHLGGPDHPVSKLPITFAPARVPPDAHADAYITKPFRTQADGLFVFLHGDPQKRTAHAKGFSQLDDATIERLRSLGYIR